jgi:heat shock protein HslJ/predicted DNA-binding ribbon-helix-helix protein
MNSRQHEAGRIRPC